MSLGSRNSRPPFHGQPWAAQRDTPGTWEEGVPSSWATSTSWTTGCALPPPLLSACSPGHWHRRSPPPRPPVPRGLLMCPQWPESRLELPCRMARTESRSEKTSSPACVQITKCNMKPTEALGRNVWKPQRLPGLAPQPRAPPGAPSLPQKNSSAPHHAGPCTRIPRAISSPSPEPLSSPLPLSPSLTPCVHSRLGVSAVSQRLYRVFICVHVHMI